MVGRVSSKEQIISSKSLEVSFRKVANLNTFSGMVAKNTYTRASVFKPLPQ